MTEFDWVGLFSPATGAAADTAPLPALPYLARPYFGCQFGSLGSMAMYFSTAFSKWRMRISW